MKILIATDDYWPNFDGGALFERKLAHGLASRGHEVRVVAPGINLKNYEESDGLTKIYRLRAGTFIFSRRYKVSLWPRRQVKKIIERFHPDIIHIHNPYKIGRNCLKLGRAAGVKIVATNHFMPENAFLNLPLGNLFRRVLTKLTWRYLVSFHNRADLVISPTETAIDLLKQHGLKAPAMAITNGINTEVFQPGQNTDAVKKKYNISDKPTLLYFGRVDGEKRLDLLLEACAEALKTCDFQLVLAGAGTKIAALKKMALDLGIAARAIFLGAVPEEDKPLIYNLADIFAITSPAELQSIVTLEAMASELPIIAVDAGALKELVIDGSSGFLVKFGDTEEFSRKIKGLLNNSEAAKRMGAAGRLFAQKNHDDRISLDAHERAYAGLLAQHL